MQIRAVNAKYGGAVHVWYVSAEKRFMEENWRNGDKGSWLLGRFISNIIPNLLYVFVGIGVVQ